MSSPLRARVSTLFLSRLPLRVQSVARTNGASIERVRFVPLRARPRQAISVLITAVVLYGIFNSVVFSPLDKLELDEETEKELDEAGSSIFIPFPGTIKQVQPPPYRGSDPEWQEYIKFSKDLALGKRIRDELAILTQKRVEKYPILTMRCGKDIQLRRYWLDVDFPVHPPPEFERSGIEIADDYIAWTSMPVDSLTVFRIRQALWPSALAQSLWSFSKVLFWHDSSVIGNLPGLQTKPRPPVDEVLAQAMKRSSSQSQNSKQPAEENISASTTTEENGVDDPLRKNQIPATNKSSLGQWDRLRKATEVGEQRNQEEKDNRPRAIDQQILKALMAFKMKFAQTWRPAPNYPPRGSILVSGLIELESPKAWLVLDVKAAWDPKTKEYDYRSMHIRLRRLQMKRQAPIGGH